MDKTSRVPYVELASIICVVLLLTVALPATVAMSDASTPRAPGQLPAAMTASQDPTGQAPSPVHGPEGVSLVPEIPSSLDAGQQSEHLEQVEDAAACDEPVPAPLRQCATWRTTNDEDGGRDRVMDEILSPDGSTMFLAGESGAYGYTHSTPLGNLSQFTVLALDAATGDKQWISTIDGPESTWDSAMGLEVSPDGERVYATGYIDFQDAFTVAYDADTGEEIWSVREDLPTPGWSIGYDLEAGPDGDRVYLTALSLGLAPGDYHTIAYDADTGERLWLSSYDGPVDGNARDWAHSLALSPDGSTVIVTGESDGYVPGGISQAGRDIATVAYDAATGEEAWVARYNGPADDMDIVDFIGEVITVTPDGSTVLVTGASTDESGTLDTVTVAYDVATGTELWTHRFDGGGFHSAPSELAASPDSDSLYVATYVQPTQDGPTDYAVIAIDAQTGTSPWVATYDGSREASDWASSVAVSPDGTVYVTGTANVQRVNSLLLGDIATLALDPADGGPLWTAVYDGRTGQYDNPAGVLATSNGVYVGGTTQSTAVGQALPPAWDALALSYAADGPSATVPGLS